MRARRIIEGAAFGPEVLNLAMQAFNETWAHIAHLFSPDEHEDARETLARAVMSATRGDSANTAAIKEAALSAMQRSYPLRFGGPDDGGESAKIL